MRKAAIIICSLLLVGCARETTVTDDVFNDIHNDIGELTQQLPKECKTDAVNAKITTLNARVTLAQKSCNKDVKNCEAETRRWKYRFYGLVALIAIVISLRLYGRVVKIL